MSGSVFSAFPLLLASPRFEHDLHLSFRSLTMIQMDTVGIVAVEAGGAQVQELSGPE